MFSRLFQRVALFVAPLCLFLLSGCSKEDLTVRQSTLDPKGPVAQLQYDVFMDTVYLVVVLFALVGGLLVSQFLTLLPGDIITTGTPPGVGMGMKPQRFLKPGDTMKIGIEGLGEQFQTVVRDK